MIVKNHRLEGVEFVRTPNGGSPINPIGIVLHDTAGRTASSSISWLTNRKAKASAHLVVGRDGKITQLMEFNRSTWHAGKSSYRGRSNCNGFTVGIEIDNPGKLDQNGRAWFGTRYDNPIHKATQSHGDGWWLDYTGAQVEAVTDICVALKDKYDIEFITTHWEISPGRKVDTNPLFPLDELRAHVFGNADHEDGGGSSVIADVNLRAWPSTISHIIKVVPRFTRVEAVRPAFREDGKWLFVRLSDGEGWIHSDYVKE